MNKLSHTAAQRKVAPRGERRSGRPRHFLGLVRGGVPHPATQHALRLRARFDHAKRMGWDALLRPPSTPKPPTPRAAADALPDWWTRAVSPHLQAVTRPIASRIDGALYLDVFVPEAYEEVYRLSADIREMVNAARAGEPPFRCVIVRRRPEAVGGGR